MKTLLRTIVWLALVVWLGGLLFFPITAWAAFSTIADTHAAGTIVAKCLNVLHHEGFIAGAVIVLFGLHLVGWLIKLPVNAGLVIGGVLTMPAIWVIRRGCGLSG